MPAIYKPIAIAMVPVDLGVLEVAVTSTSDNSLTLYHGVKFAGNQDLSWSVYPVANADTTFSGPVITIGPPTIVEGLLNPQYTVNIAAVGPNNTLMYYFAAGPENGFTGLQIDGPSLSSVVGMAVAPSGVYILALGTNGGVVFLLRACGGAVIAEPRSGLGQRSQRCDDSQPNDSPLNTVSGRRGPFPD